MINLLLICPLLALAIIAQPIDEKQCTCVPYYQCNDDDGNLITDGAGLLDLRSSTCTGDLDVCCNVTSEFLQELTQQPEIRKGCGYHEFGSFPWAASLFHTFNNISSKMHKCGTSLIHLQVLITAAHCVFSDENYLIEINNMQHNVKKTIIHPHYNPITLHNDLALLVLDQPIPTSDHVGLICIPSPGSTPYHINCIVSSWSHQQRPFSRTPSPHLKMLKLPIVPKEKCLQALRTTRLGPFFQLHPRFICAGGVSHQDTCGGDGGSPLVCPIPGEPARYHQVGVVSWGIGCGEYNVPGVYVNLAAYREWIDAEMIGMGFDISVYRY